jgi:hypothetical protein
VLLYFSTAPLPQSHDPEQWRMLKDYQQTLRKDTLYWNFSTPEELYRLASRHLAAVIHEISAELGEGLSIEAAPPIESSKDASTNLPVARPIIVPKRYRGGTTKDDFGYTGLGVVNDGQQPGYDLAIHKIQLADGTKLVFHRGHTERLTKTDGEAFYPAFLEARLGGTFGSALFDFMRERGIPSITVPITYRDSNNNWFQTDVTFERDVQKSGGLRLGWTQKRIPEPTPESA